MNKYEWFGPDKTTGKFEYEGREFDQFKIREKLKGKPNGQYLLSSQTISAFAFITNNDVEKFQLL